MPGGASLTGPTILMTTTTTFSFTHRPLVPFSHDYAHGDSEPWHQHDCAQLLHSLTGVVRVDTASGCWVVRPVAEIARHIIERDVRVNSNDELALPKEKLQELHI